MKFLTKERVVLFGLLVLTVLLAMIQCNRISRLKTKLAVEEQNNAALTDSVRVVKNKAGELEFVKLTLIADKKELENLNSSLAEELKKERGKVRTITEIKTTVKRDTIFIPSGVESLADNMYRLSWKHSEENAGGSRYLEGKSEFKVENSIVDSIAGTTITRDEINLKIITGLRERNDKKLEIFARTAYPNASFDLDGAIIDPKDSIFFHDRKRFSFGPVISGGLNQDLKLGFHLGIGLQYSLFRF